MAARKKAKCTLMTTDDTFPTRKRMRFEGFDYSTPMCYFITIVTNKRENLFGHIENGEMRLNSAGLMVYNEYHTLEKTHQGINCMDAVIMPNHFHCIIRLKDDSNINIFKVIDAFKSRTTVRYIYGVKELGWKTFDQHIWQRSYWDDIIWNQRQLEFVMHYIFLNPSRWDKDNLNPNHSSEVDHILQGLKKLR